MDDAEPAIDPAIDEGGFYHRVTCYLEGSLAESELAILSSELVNDAAKQSLFAQICLMRAALVWDGLAARKASDIAARQSGESFFDHHAGHAEDFQPQDFKQGEESDSDETAPAAAATLDDAVILPALTGSIDEEPVVMKISPAKIKSAASENTSQGKIAAMPRIPGKIGWKLGWSSAAIVLVGVTVWVLSRNGTTRHPAPSGVTAPIAADPSYAATVTATASAVADDHASFKCGTGYLPGASLHLLSGALQLTMGRGATVVVTGPAELQITDDNSLALSSGTLVTLVPVRAHGFTADCPGLNVVDLGTEFGLRVDPAHSNVVLNVFEGKVSATTLDNHDQPVGSATVITQDHAAQHDPAVPAKLAAAEFKPEGFNRNIDQIRLPVPTHGTGVGIDPGKPDPAWRIMSVPDNPDWPPQPALRLKELRGDYVPGRPDAHWISAVNDSSQMAVGNYVFQTTIDLTGFDPASVDASMSVAVDDYVRAIRVNGETAEFKSDSDASYYFAPRSLPFVSHAWHAGANVVEVIIMNRDDGTKEGGNPMALQLRWDLTAAMAVKR